MNVIVFVLRGCPAGWLGAYGNEWVATPNLDRLAAESVVFDRHISECPTPEAAHAAWLPHGPPPGSVLIRANHPETDSPPEFYAGWGEVFDARPQEGDASPLDELLRTLPRVLERDAPVVWIEIDRLLPPWDVSQDVFEAYIADEDEEIEKIEPLADPELGSFDTSDAAAWEWLHASFAAVVTSLDAELGAAFELLRERGLDKSATWVVSSDYGLPLGEHGIIGPDGSELHEELVHVPLIVRNPDAADAGRRATDMTRPGSLKESLLARRAHEVVVSRMGGSAAVRTEQWALIVPAEGSLKLYTKPDDRWEVHDVASMHEDVVQELTERGASAPCADGGGRPPPLGMLHSIPRAGHLFGPHDLVELLAGEHAGAIL
ncbi:MAG: sulfatase-like hydrolase/transferase [Gemmataceae bacterium]